MNKIKINNKITIGESFPTFTIAEIGSNHNQSLSLAKEMICAAKESGADAVKFQSLNANELYSNPTKEIIELHKLIDLEESWHKELNDYCDKENILFFSAPTYLKAVDILKSLSVDLYKIASAQIGTFPPLIEKVAKENKPTLISTGIVTYNELEKAISIFEKNKNNKYVILHCNSLYPTPYEKANLKLINIYKKMFDCIVGYSDHTNGIYASLAAVTIGAKVIERHFTIDKKLNVPDAPISITPSEFKEMVNGIRAIEKSLIFDKRINLQNSEKSFKQKILYRLILKNNKSKGDCFYYNDFEFKRHNSGIDVRDIEIIINKMQANQIIKKGELLQWEMLKGRKL